MTPIKINNNSYYFKNITDISYNMLSPYAEIYSHTNFYIKGKPIKERIIKYKYWLFGPVLEDKIIEEDNFILCFKTHQEINADNNYDVKKIKIAEELYQRKVMIDSGKLEI